MATEQILLELEEIKKQNKDLQNTVNALSKEIKEIKGAVTQTKRHCSFNSWDGTPHVFLDD